MTKTTKYTLLLLAGFILYYLIPIDYRALWQPDETRYAEISREMLVSGNWIVPHFFDLRYFEKPIMGYWINNIGQWLFGHNNFAVRAGSIFSTAVTALLVAWQAWAMWRDKRTAVYAAIIFLTTFLVYGVGSYAVLDPMIAMWLMLALCCFWLAMQAPRATGKAAGFILLGVACGFGVMTKGFLALAVPVISVIPWVISQKRWKDLFLFGPLAVLSAVLVTLPWGLAIASREPDFWRYFFWVEHIQRFAEENAQHKAPFWYYLPILLVAALPWLGLLPGALRLGWRGRRLQPHAFYLLGWVVMPFILFSIAKGKLPTYILPCFAPLAILLARYVLQARRGLLLNGWINVLTGVICMLIVLLALSPWGLRSHQLYNEHEWLKVIFALLAFGWWMIMGLLSLCGHQRRWSLAALCPLGVALLVGLAIPQKIIDAKQPQSFIQAIHMPLSQSEYLLANDPGIASAVAWELQRSDIILFHNSGELQYGLQYPDASGKLVHKNDFARWLTQHRQKGAVSLLLLCPREHGPCAQQLPAPDFLYRRGRLAYLHYRAH